MASPRDKFESQAERLRKACADRKKYRQRTTKEKSAGVAKEIEKTGYRFPFVSKRQKEYARYLREIGATVDDIAQIMKTDILTIAIVLSVKK